MVVIMKKIMTLVLTSIVCSQLIYGVASKRDQIKKEEVKRQIKPEGGNLKGLANANLETLQKRLRGNPRPTSPQAYELQLLKSNGRPLKSNGGTAESSVLLRQTDIIPEGQTDIIPEGQARKKGGIVGWAKWLIGGCFGCGEATARFVEEHPEYGSAACALCCAGCGMFLGASVDNMTPGHPVANMYGGLKTCCYGASVVAAVCCIGPCARKATKCLDLNKNVSVCARCFAKAAARVKELLSREDR